MALSQKTPSQAVQSKEISIAIRSKKAMSSSIVDQRSSLAFGHRLVSEDQAASLLAAVDIRAEEVMEASHTVVLVVAVVVRFSALEEHMILTEAAHPVVEMAVEAEAEAEIEITIVTIGETTGDHQETTAVPGVIENIKMAWYIRSAFHGVYG